MALMGTAQRTSDGTVWWITGLSGAGKSTIARLVQQGLRLRGRPALLLDGDVLRSLLGRTEGYDADERRRLAMIYARLAREVAGQGIEAVCATISMFHAVRAWNRANIPNYREIYLRVPVAELESRDPRALYANARAGSTTNLVGIDLAAEEPLEADLVIDNFGPTSPQDAADRILALADRR